MLKSEWICLSLLVVLSFVPAGAKLFDCDDEYCNWNGTTEEYDCYYIGCPERPDFIKNLTFENVTKYNITQCDMSVIDQHQDVFMERVDNRINFTQALGDKQDSLDNCRRELALLIQRDELNRQFYVNRTELRQCQMQRDTALNRPPVTNWSYVIGAAALFLFVGWFAKDYKRELPSEDNQPVGGKKTHEPDAVDRATMKGELESKTKENKELLEQNATFRDKILKLEAEAAEGKKK